jgi:hypothetical protein
LLRNRVIVPGKKKARKKWLGAVVSQLGIVAVEAPGFRPAGETGPLTAALAAGDFAVT